MKTKTAENNLFFIVYTHDNSPPFKDHEALLMVDKLFKIKIEFYEKAYYQTMFIYNNYFFC